MVDGELVRPTGLRIGFGVTGDFRAADFGGAMSWGGCLAAAGLGALCPCSVVAADGDDPLACFVGRPGVCKDLSTEVDRSTTGAALALSDFLPPSPLAAVFPGVAPGFGAIVFPATDPGFGATGFTAVGLTGLGFWVGLGAIGTVCSTTGAALALSDFLAPSPLAAVFPGAERLPVWTLTTLGRLGLFLTAVAVPDLGSPELG